MPAQSLHLEAAQDLALLLGPRQAEIMWLLWRRGPATVYELHAWLTQDRPLAYTTVMNLCLRLTEKGLLERRPVDGPGRRGKAYVYTPRLSEEAFTRAAVEQRIAPVLTHYPALIQEQVAGVPSRRPNGTLGSDRARVEYILAYLATLRDPQDQPIEDTVLDTIAALLERAEAAERAAETQEVEVGRAEQHTAAVAQRALAAEQRALAAERRAERAERQLEATLRELNRPPKQERRAYVRAETAHEYRDPAGICRVCGRKAPPPHAGRHDDLRVCTAPECRQEARRRDNNAKQRRSLERRRARGGQVEVTSSALPSRTQQQSG